MTKDQFLNSWSKELSTESAMNPMEAKKFLHAFYNKVIGFEKPIEITEEKIEMDTPFPEEWDGNIKECEVFQRGVRAAAKTILSKLKGE